MKLERQNLARSLEWAAFFLLLMTLAARPFIAEMPYRAPIVAVGSMSAGQGAGTAMPRDREEFSRVTFAVLILAIGALWVVGGAVGGGIKVRGGWLGVLIAAFGVLSLASTLAASDQRTALDCWVEQLSLLVAAFLAVQLCADKRRFVLLAILLGALAAAMAAQGFWQRAETSSNVADFNMYRDEFLAAHGWVAGSPQDQAAEARFKDTAVRGFFALSNMFASLMIVLTLACGGLAFANLREAIGRRKATSGEPQATSHKPQATKGKAVTLSQRAGDIQIDPQMIAGVAALLGAAAGAVVLAMALSRGGVIAGALAAIAAVVVYAKRASLARHWKRWLLCVALGLVLVGAGVTAWGLTPDGLPIPGSATKTMTFRWFYWTGSVQIIRDNPLLGVGGGNFDTAYLQHRRAAAEESVKMPHNVLLHSLTQFGIPGGLCYIAIIAMVLVGASRPGGDREGNISPPGEQEFPRSSGGSASNRRLLLALVLLAPLAALVTRWMFGGVAAGDQKEIISSLLVDAVSPAVILAGALAILGLAGPGGVGLFGSTAFPGCELEMHPPRRVLPVRIAMACGCWGFFVHGLVEMSFWVPGSAMIFWVAAGACMAQGGGLGWHGRPAREFRRALWAQASRRNTWAGRPCHNRSQAGRPCHGMRWLAAGGAIIGVCAAAGFLWLPCAKKDALGARLQEAVEARNASDAAALCAEMAAADPLDPIPPAQTARFLLRICPPAGPVTHTCLAQAANYAQEAAERGPRNSSYWELAAQAKWLQADSDNFKYWNPPVVAADKDFRATTASQANALASAYSAKGDHGAAGQALEKAVELDEKSWLLHARLGDALWMEGRRDRACAQWGMAAQLAPHINTDSYDPNAIDLALRAVSLDPMNSRVRLWAAKFFCDAREADMCLGELEAARKIQAALLNPSVEAFNPAEMRQVKMLEDHARCIGR